MSDSDSTAQWDEVRTAFASSIMVDTALSSLAENLDGPEWPGTDKQDSPADYIDLGHDEAVAALAQKGYPPEAMSQLIEILQETLAFDDPFGDMVEHSAAAAEADNPVLENLKKLEIPESYPLAHSSLSADAKEFCELEGLGTLAEFAVFAQNMAQNVIVGGDFKTLLNALSHIDEQAIAKFLPFRPGSKGLHLVEALGNLARGLRPLEQDKIKSGIDPSIETTGQAAKLVQYFADDLAQIKERVAGGGELSREIIVLQDPAIEPVVTRLLQDHLPAAEPAKKTGWLGRLFGR
jgi:hypothetical protein